MSRPSRSLSSSAWITLHSSAAGLSATRIALTFRHGAMVSPANSNSLTPGATPAELTFIALASATVDRLQTNSPVAMALAGESFIPSLEKPTIGGLLAIAAKKLNLPPETVPELLRTGGSRWDVYLEAARIDDLKDITDWMRDNKRLAAEPGDLRRILAPEFLRKVAPASVRGF